MRSKFWFWNLLSGLIVFILLGWHMAVMHLPGFLEMMLSIPAEPFAWEAVVARGRSAVYAGTYVLLLGAALFHGFYGLRTILTEYWSSKGAEKLITVSCWVVGGGLFTVGTYTTIAFHSSSLVP